MRYFSVVKKIRTIPGDKFSWILSEDIADPDCQDIVAVDESARKLHEVKNDLEYAYAYITKSTMYPPNHLIHTSVESTSEWHERINGTKFKMAKTPRGGIERLAADPAKS